MDSAEGNGPSRSIAKSLQGTVCKAVFLIGSWASLLAVFFCMSMNAGPSDFASMASLGSDYPQTFFMSQSSNSRVKFAGMTSLVPLSISFPMTHSLLVCTVCTLFYSIVHCECSLNSANSLSSRVFSLTSQVVNVSQLSGLSTDRISGIAQVLTTDKKRIDFQGRNCVFYPALWFRKVVYTWRIVSCTY